MIYWCIFDFTTKWNSLEFFRYSDSHPLFVLVIASDESLSDPTRTSVRSKVSEIWKFLWNLKKFRKNDQQVVCCLFYQMKLHDKFTISCSPVCCCLFIWFIANGISNRPCDHQWLPQAICSRVHESLWANLWALRFASLPGMIHQQWIMSGSSDAPLIN